MTGPDLAEAEDWKAAWAPVIAQIGTDIGGYVARAGADRVEAGAIRRFLEPLEFDCPLHYDAALARAHGRADIVAPCAALLTFAMAELWAPGMQLFTSAARDAQPANTVVKPALPPGAPPVTGYFATDFEVEFLREVTIGERLTRKGNLLLACEPKETKVGRGAFLKFEMQVCDEAGEVVARYTTGLFLYNPHPPVPA